LVNNIDPECSAGAISRNAVSTSSWNTTSTVIVTLQAIPGYYVSGQSCVSCSGSVYSLGGPVSSCAACPTATPGYTLGTGVGWDSVTDCFETRLATDISEYCAAGVVTKTAATTTLWNTLTITTPFQAKAGSYVNVTSCSQCPAGTYTTTQGTQTSCTSCAIGSYQNSIGQTSCAACQGGRTTTTVGMNYCNIDCSNTDSVMGWLIATFDNSSNTITDLCAIDSCQPGYYTLNNACVPTAYNISYHLNGGTHSGIPATYNTEQTTILVNPTRIGYTFTGWCDDSGLTTNCSTNKQINVGNIGDKEFWAKWTANHYTIMFDGNNNNGGSLPSQVICTYDTQCNMPARGTLSRNGYIWVDWCTNSAGNGICSGENNTVINLSATDSSSVTLYAHWTGCGASKFSNTNNNTCDTCASGQYSVGAANASCTSCEPGNRCALGVKTACSGINEWQSDYGQSVCSTVTDGYKKDTNYSLTTCGVGSFCKDGVITACPVAVLDGLAETTANATAAVITECFQPVVDCIPNVGGYGVRICHYHPEVSQYCWPEENPNYNKDEEYCIVASCTPDKHMFGERCTSNNQSCTSAEVGLIGANVQGSAFYQADAWNKSSCYKVDMPHEGGFVHGAGTKNCNYTSGNGLAAIFDNACTNYNITSCDAGYYRYAPSDISCTPVGVGYYSPEGSITRTACPNNGTTIGNMSSDATACFKQNMTFIGTHCVGRQTCYWTSGDTYDTNCEVTSITGCDAGYYYYNDGENDDAPNGTIVPIGYYSVAESTVSLPCPSGGLTENMGSSSLGQCYKSCPTMAMPPHGASISYVRDKEFYAADRYPDCTYDFTCETGYTPAITPSVSPQCLQNQITIIFDKNAPDAQENMESLTCGYGDSCNVPDNRFRRAGYVFSKWCTASNGTGDCVSANGDVSTLISVGITTLYAQWDVCDNGKYSDLNNSSGLVCQTCAPGSFTPDDNNNHPSCNLCSAGYYQPESGANTCSATENECPAGKYCPIGSTSYDSLPDCLAGYYCPLKSMNETGHVAGGDTSDKLCLAGYYCPTGSTNNKGQQISDSSEKICPAGNYCPTNSPDPVICPTGQFCLEGVSVGTACPTHHSCMTTGLPEVVCSSGFTLSVNSGTGTRSCIFASGSCSIGQNGYGEINTTNGTCVLVGCNGDNHMSADRTKCEPNIVECTTANGFGNKIWTDTLYSQCMEVSCRSGYGLDGDECVPCNIENVETYKTMNDGTCVVNKCKVKFHLDGNACVPDTDTTSCNIENGKGNRTWSSGAWSSCAVTDCNDGYHIESNACVANEKSCSLTNGTGSSTWTGTAISGRWGDCIPETCDAGYTSDKSLTNDWKSACGRCSNYFGGDGEPAVSSYSEGCTIAVCMYQGEKYILQDGECVPICDARSDDTGSMIFNSSTNKCQRSCETGFISW
jgi:uncharacterized repeat protein (TIGR02543 family)